MEMCYAVGPLKVKASLWSQHGSPLPPTNPSNNLDLYVNTMQLPCYLS